MKTLIALAAGAAVVAAAACGSSTAPGGPVGGSSNTIEGLGSSVCVSGAYGGGQTCTFYFNPTPDTVSVGTVNFKFDDITHQVEFDTPGSPTDTLPRAMNQTIPVTFPTAGTYAYHCTIHTYMHGTVVVH